MRLQQKSPSPVQQAPPHEVRRARRVLLLLLLAFLVHHLPAGAGHAVVVYPKFPSIKALLEHRADIATDSKGILAEVGSHLFNARHPSYTWTSRDAASITTAVAATTTTHLTLEVTLKEDSARFRCFFAYDNAFPSQQQPRLPTAAARKLAEHHVAALVVEHLASCGEHSRQLDTWRRHRQNRDNQVHVLPTTAAAVAAAHRKVVILVDAENVPDVRRCFYVSADGAVQFLSPRIPRVLAAPAVDAPAEPFADDVPLATRAVDTHADADADVDDTDLLVLTYAQARSAQAAWTTRRTSSTHRDAADSLMLFDLGALSLVPTVRRLVLVTQDRFGANAASFFADGPDALTRFDWVTSCADVARSLGRISL
jgi:hypothetical protein